MKISVVQQLILDAMIRLLDIYDFDKITITQLTQEAKVARKTFYLNFDSKEQVIEMYVSEMQSKFESRLQHENVNDFRELSQEFFMFFGEYAEFLNILIKNKQFQIIIKKSEKFIDKRVAQFKNPLYELETITPTEKIYITKYHSAGLWQLLQCWITSGMVESPKEMSQLYVKIIRI